MAQRKRRDGQPTTEEMPQGEGAEALTIDWAKVGGHTPGGVDERQADARADSAPPGGAAAEGDGEQLAKANEYGQADAKASIAFIGEQRQIIADASMKIASEMKSIEKRGGSRAGVQFALRILKQDPVKARKELEAIDKMRDWFITPMLAEAESGGSEG